MTACRRRLILMLDFCRPNGIFYKLSRKCTWNTKIKLFLRCWIIRLILMHSIFSLWLLSEHFYYEPWTLNTDTSNCQTIGKIQLNSICRISLNAWTNELPLLGTLKWWTTKKKLNWQRYQTLLMMYDFIMLKLMVVLVVFERKIFKNCQWYSTREMNNSIAVHLIKKYLSLNGSICFCCFIFRSRFCLHTHTQISPQIFYGSGMQKWGMEQIEYIIIELHLYAVHC